MLLSLALIFFGSVFVGAGFARLIVASHSVRSWDRFFGLPLGTLERRAR
jgi:hypothetical protein